MSVAGKVPKAPVSPAPQLPAPPPQLPAAASQQQQQTPLQLRHSQVLPVEGLSLQPGQRLMSDLPGKLLSAFCSTCEGSATWQRFVPLMFKSQPAWRLPLQTATKLLHGPRQTSPMAAEPM